MKKILGICLDDYKKRSVKIFVGERNGIGKEFRKGTNIIVFEGQYLKGKKNGRGKEYYDDGKLKFEGDYLNGIKIEGKGYNKEGQLILEINRNGEGK